MEIRLLHGAAIAPYIDDLARLRLTVFREFPYLYDGTPEYEADYLASYARSGRSLVVLALDDGQVIGASTALPLVDVAPEFQQPFLALGRDPASVYYFGESLVLPEYRGRGLGVRFSSSANPMPTSWPSSTSARSVRSSDRGHPRRPADYKPLHGFWRNRGFLHDPSLRTRYAWRDLDEQESSEKILSFWTKELPI